MNHEFSGNQIFSAFIDARTYIDHAQIPDVGWNRYASMYLSKDVKDPSGESLKELNSWYEIPENNKLANKILQSSINVVHAFEHGKLGEIKVAGHDMENTIHVCSEVLRMTHNNRLSPYETWEFALSSVLHNWGRWLGYDDKIHQATGAYLISKMAKDLFLKEKPSTLESTIISRLINNILDHSKNNNGDPIGDLIKNCDRMQQIVPVGPFREILYDVGKDDNPIFPPINEKYMSVVPAYIGMDSSGLSTSWLNWVEFMSRNLYPFFNDKTNFQNPKQFQEIMQQNQYESDKRKTQSITLLMILSGYITGEKLEKQPPLARQIFAPELGIATSDAHWSKKQIQKNIFQQAEKEYKSFLLAQNYKHVDQLLISNSGNSIIRLFLEATNSYVDPKIWNTINSRLDEVSLDDQKKLLLGLSFCFDKYRNLIHKEYERAITAKSNSNSDIQPIGQLVSSFIEEYKFTDSAPYQKLSKILEYK
jgi:hypothetical protein